MGLNIREIVDRNEINVKDLKGKIVCVDAFNTLYQFLSTVRQMDGTPLMDSAGCVTSHLSGILYRNVALLSEGVKLIYVFDGEAPSLKAKTHKKRKEIRDLAKEKYEDAKASEDLESMKKYSSQLLRLDDEMIAESKELLEALGVMVVQAPSEGEAEAAYLCAMHSEIYASVSQDYDSLIFGAPKLIRNLTVSRKRKTPGGYIEVKPEIIELDDFLGELGINQDQLISLGVLVGTDYNPKGVPGIGQKRALDLVKKFPEPSELFDSLKDKIDELGEEDQFYWKDIFNLFKMPEVIDVEIEFPKVDADKIREILIDKHEFSPDRIEKQIDKLGALIKAGKQKNLGDWF